MQQAGRISPERKVMTTMRSLRSILCVLGLFLLAGCPSNEPALLFENAHYEESMSNWENAKTIYQDLITRFPESKEAPLAQLRLEGLKDKH